VIHRYKEIEEFPQALNNSQMWNWSTRLFITEAQANYTVEEKAGGPFKYTQEELAALEKRLVEHETWLNIHVEKQKATPLYEDPAVETSEMKRRAEVLSQELQKLVRRKAPTKPKKTTSKSSSATTASGAQETSSPSASASPSSHEEL
jgi:hypoxia up-regulated 1